MSITALPQPPTRSDPVNFNSRADAFLSALPTFATEANKLQADVNAKQAAAATSASNASAAELAANAAANVTAWVSGTTYAVGNVRYSPITFLSYRRKTAGAGTTDPSADSTNWQLINGTGNVDLNSTQTLVNKEIGSGSTVNGVPVDSLVNTTANQTVGGNKTFSNTIIGNISGNAGTATLANSVTNVSSSQVGSALAGQGVGGIGTFAFLRRSSDTGGFSAGTTAAGSGLLYSNRTGDWTGSPSGTWVCCGFSLSWDRATVWMRIS